MQLCLPDASLLESTTQNQQEYTKQAEEDRRMQRQTQPGDDSQEVNIRLQA